MRILNAASRRALDLPLVQAEPAEHDHQVTLALEVNQKQVGQLYREWYSIADVIKVSSGAAHAAEWTGPHPPVGVGSKNRAQQRGRRFELRRQPGSLLPSSFLIFPGEIPVSQPRCVSCNL